MEGIELDQQAETPDSAEVEQGGILLLSDSDSEPEDDSGSDDSLSLQEKRKKQREKEKAKRARKQQKAREAPPPAIKRYQKPQVQRISFGVGDFVELRLDTELSSKCKGAVIFEGFPSKGLSSVLLSKFLIKGLQLPMIGYIKSNLLPVLCRVSNSQPSHAFRVYGNEHIVVFTSELAAPSEIAIQLTQLIYQFQRDFECPFIFCAESIPQKIEELDVDIPDPESLTQSGLIRFVEKVAEAPIASLPNSEPSEDDVRTGKEDSEDQRKAFSSSKAKEFFGVELEPSTDPRAEIMYITNDQGVSNSLRKLGYLPVRNAVVGNITGILLAESSRSECKVVCLVARHNPIMSDARASVLLVRIMTELSGADWMSDIHQLEHKADIIEKQIKKSIREMGVSGKKNAPTYNMYT